MEGEIYLCTIRELVGDADDNRAQELMTLLGSIVQKLGYQLASGQAPRFHELWAIPERKQPAVAVAAQTVLERPDVPPTLIPGAHPTPIPAGGRDLAADDFENRFLGWLRMFGIHPEKQFGTNAIAWKFQFGDSAVSFVVVGQRKNSALAPSSHIDWLLRIEESEPTPFINQVERYFTPGSGVRRRMPGGNTRIQFKSTMLTDEFVTLTNRT